MSKRKETPDLMGDAGKEDALADLLGQRAKSEGVRAISVDERWFSKNGERKQPV